MEIKKILFVCLGNICRSPLAEGIMLKLIADNNLPLLVDSAGTSHYHIGEKPDARTIANAQKHSVNLQALQARQFQVADFEEFDEIYVMDKSNLRNVLALTSNPAHQQKVSLFLNVLENKTIIEVPDPYYSSADGFEEFFQLVYKACEKLVELHTSDK